jgi:hypothetical protein
MNPITSVRAADRRETPRVAHVFDATCSGPLGDRAVRIGDLSVSGCFVESIESPEAGERVELRIEIPSRGTVTLAATVMYNSPPVGFGVKFLDVSRDTRVVLQAAIASLLRSDAQ